MDSRRASPRGFTMLEVSAAAAVSVMALAAITPLFVRQVRLVSETRRERVALEELANQAERLAAAKIPASDLDRRLATLELSPSVRALLPEPTLKAMRGGRSLLGERVVLTLAWDAPARRAQPLEFATWLAVPPEKEAVR
jgi:prepilin-type N-terminal cleavage/methylation domain-containing protein